MSAQDSRCDDCGSRESFPFLEDGWCLCRRCAGQICQRLLRYIRGFDRDHPRPKKPRNPSKPIRDANGQVRCRLCEIQLMDWKAGDSPYCDFCREQTIDGNELALGIGK